MTYKKYLDQYLGHYGFGTPFSIPMPRILSSLRTGSTRSHPFYIRMLIASNTQALYIYLELHVQSKAPGLNMLLQSKITELGYVDRSPTYIHIHHGVQGP